jgi:hypothetical protein
MNMKYTILAALSVLSFQPLFAQEINRSKGDPKLSEYYEPAAPVVTPGKTSQDPPSDAIILFNGNDFSQWKSEKGSPIAWTLENGAMVVKGGSGGIRTKLAFGDCQLHVEFRTPAEVKGDGQGRGNSGVYLMDRYELQILDNYNNKTYVNGQVGSIYKQLPPLANASRPPGEWQTYDIIFIAPRFYADGRVKSQATITVIHNGVLVQNNATIWGGSEYVGAPVYKKHGEKEPIYLQDHGNPTAFRNIWIREL